MTDLPCDTEASGAATITDNYRPTMGAILINLSRPNCGLPKDIWDALIAELEIWDRRFDGPESILEVLLEMMSEAQIRASVDSVTPAMLKAGLLEWQSAGQHATIEDALRGMYVAMRCQEG